MDKPSSEEPDIEAAAVTFLHEFCDLFIPTNDMVVLAMYRAYKEIKRLREKNHSNAMIAKAVHDFEEQLNRQLISELEQENNELRLSLIRINKNLGIGSKN